MDSAVLPANQITDRPDRFKTTPYAHQLLYLTKYGRREYFALLADMGTGKTWMIINELADLWASNDCDGVIIFAPNGVHTNWTRLMIPEHMPDWVRYRAAAWVSGANRREQKELDEMNANVGSGELRILAMNWETLTVARAVDFATKFACSCRRLMIVADESDVIKNPTAKRTKVLMALKKYSAYRRIMTGTPVDGNPFDFFSQFMFLNDEILRTTSYWAFKAEYAEMLHKGVPLLKALKRQGIKRMPQIVAKGVGGRPKYKNLDKLSRLIAPHSFRVLKSECLDLPEKIYKTLIFRMTPQQIEVYLKAEQECRLVFENEETPFNKLVAVTKLSQITSGYFIHPHLQEPVRIEGENPKLEMMVERILKLKELGEKVLIWARYRIEIADIVERLSKEGLTCVEYHGGVGRGDRVDALEEFEHGKADAFIGNQQAGGTGLTIIAASNVFYFSNDFRLRNRLQSEDRSHRIGQSRNVTYFNIVGKGTIDEKVVRALINKKEVSDMIIDQGLKLFGNAEPSR